MRLLTPAGVAAVVACGLLAASCGFGPAEPDTSVSPGPTPAAGSPGPAATVDGAPPAPTSSPRLPSPTPSTTPQRAAPSPGATGAPPSPDSSTDFCAGNETRICEVRRIPEPIAVDGADPTVVADVTRAAERLAGLTSYRFELAVTGGRYTSLVRDEYSDFEVRGELTRDPKVSLAAEFTTGHPAIFGEEAERATVPLGFIDEVWETLVADGVYEARPMTRDHLVWIWLPDGVVARRIVPFAAAFARAGEVDRDGVAAVRYRLTDAGARALADAMLVDGTWSGELWIAKRGGYLLGASIRCEVRPDSPAWLRGFELRLAITDVNDPGITIEAD